MFPSYNSVLLFLLLFSLLPPAFPRGGGGRGGGFGGRGASGARGGVFGGSKGSSGGGGGFFGGRARSGGNNMNRGTNYGNSRGSSTGSKGGGWFSGGSSSGNRGKTGGYYGGGSSSTWNRDPPRYSKSGIGSSSRASTFKNMIVGAAAGYLTYQAGRAIINAAAGPMMWNNRPYYWGTNYYRPTAGMSNMCRMPIEGDSQFGNVYFQDQSRPREIVWGCGYYEHCCGYECCRGGGAGGYGRGLGIGFVLVIVLLLGLVYLIFRYFKQRRHLRSNVYQAGQISKVPSTAGPFEPPPAYPYEQAGPSGYLRP